MGRRSKRRSSKSLSITGAAVVLVIVVVLVTVRFVADIGPEPQVMQGLTVALVLDGDTVDLTNGERLRLLGIDTPERGEPFYDDARLLLIRLALGRPARVVTAGRERDKYGRLLGYLYIDDTLLVNKALLDSGLAYLYLFGDTDDGQPITEVLLDAQRAAMDARTGFWTAERSAEEYYVESKNSHRFNRPGGSAISQMPARNRRVFKTREEALYEGLSPCRQCKP